MFPSLPSFLLFLAGALVLLVIPGPAVFYILSRTVGNGRTAGVVSAAGIAAGTLVHVGAAILGLSALLASSARAFYTVKYLGAAYLVLLGLRMLFRREAPEIVAARNGHGLGRVFAEGVLVNLLNPKTALFFLAFLPQFVDPARGHVSLQILFLGTSFALFGLASDSSWALLAGSLAEKLRGNLRWRRAQQNLSGGALIALGLATAFSGAHARTK
jgi:threonine/homoserine/homoserine lactone efflux protein